MLSTGMAERLILLTGPVEQSYLPNWLSVVHTDLMIEIVQEPADLMTLTAGDCRSTALLAFLTNIIVPASVLTALDGRAVNIHPGPPAYPGSDAGSWALLEGAQEFGATAHRMVEKIDAGAIIATEMFPLRPDWTLEQLNEQAYIAAMTLVRRLLPQLVETPIPLPVNGQVWTGRCRTRRDRRLLLDQYPTLPARDQERIRRAFDLSPLELS